MSTRSLSALARRALASCVMALGCAAIVPAAHAAGNELTIAYPVDVPSWDPTAGTWPAAQSLYKAVFDSPLLINDKLEITPRLIESWKWLDDKNTRLDIVLRSGVTFQDGSKLTTEDFKYTFFDRPQTDKKLVINSTFTNKLSNIEIKSPTEAVMDFKNPTPTAPDWLAFMTAYILPKAYIEKVGTDQFLAHPIGAGPYKLVSYERGSRAVLEAYDGYWGPKPAIKRVVFNFTPDPSARVAMLESGRADVAVQIPVRDSERLKTNSKLVSKVYPYTQIFIVQLPSYVTALQNVHVRRAMQLAINKQALSRAFFANTAKPISVLALPGTPAYVDDVDVKYDPKAAEAELAKAGFSPSKPLEIPFMSANGSTPGDYDMARALVQMWSKIGIKADLQEVTLAKYMELSHSSKLTGPMLYSWDNATADPEIFAGYILNPNLPFSAWKQPELADTFKQLSALPQAQRIAGYQAIEKKATEDAWSIPLIQSVTTIAYKKTLNLNTYQTGYIMPQEYSWKQ